MADRAKIVSTIAQRYTKARSAKDQLRLLTQWRLAERFWQADQWPAGTPRTFPQPVLNLVWEFVERKVAVITGEDPRITYRPRTPGVDPAKADNLNVAAEWEWDRTGMTELYDSVLRTAALMGTAIVQVAFNPDLSGGSEKGKTLWQGGIEMVEIDPPNFFPGDSVISNIQDQPYIIIGEEMPLSRVKELYRQWAREVGTNVDDLQAAPNSSGELNIYPQENVEREGVAFVLKMWWKENGKLNYAVAAQGRLLRYTEGIYEHGMYPFISMRWYPRRKSFWGLSEFSQLLPNQQSVNRLLGFLINSGQMTGLPQRRVKQGALQNPSLWVPGDSSLVLVDSWNGNGWGIDYMQPPSPSPAVMQTLDYMVQRTRSAMGILDALTGQAPSSQLNATAIAYLQQAAAVLMKPVIRRAHAFLEDVGRLWFAFWTEPDLFKATRTITVKSPDGPRPVEFRGDDYADEEYDVEIELNAGDFFDMAAQTQLVQEFVRDGLITQEEALEAIPSKMFPAKDTILRKRQEAQSPPPQPQQTPQAPPSILAALGGGPGAAAPSEGGIPVGQ